MTLETFRVRQQQQTETPVFVPLSLRMTLDQELQIRAAMRQIEEACGKKLHHVKLIADRHAESQVYSMSFVFDLRVPSESKDE